MNINNCVYSSDFQPASMSFSVQETRPRIESESPSSGFYGLNRHQNPRKKRTNFIRIDNSLGVTKPKCSKKPDPSAPKITRPCSECGKKFWSWKALFGHMRCHPERQWRGINPPPNFRLFETPTAAVRTDREATASGVTEEDHEVASCLLMLANGGSSTAAFSDSPSVTNVCSTGILESDSGGGVVGVEDFRFECSSCKKVFGSHQALGGHRASHKNVKGCYAIHKNVEIGEEEQEQEQEWINNGSHVDQSIDVMGHKCSICLRVFSTGQALGGHKRCHWEKLSEEATSGLGLYPAEPEEANCGLDLDLNLNLPASAPARVPIHEEDVSSSTFFYSAGLELDLRLGL
ncbi:unnamed protein product [Fraxinus pennsylvanica]|uniref:C2H2-type domain-containing protein n=1 Tax=Fraxinus pennsylvanica TaxID=56036 RepID=A0AAD2E2F2_9LAMI|nr:unnamed protein product [Fraxinus pennsylvanica]